MITTKPHRQSFLRPDRRRKRQAAALIQMLTRSVQEFNAWRERHPGALFTLEGRNLSGLDLTGVNLEGANIAFVNFRGTNLTSADLSRTYFDGADFTDAITIGASFEDAWESVL